MAANDNNLPPITGPELEGALKTMEHGGSAEEAAPDEEPQAAPDEQPPEARVSVSELYRYSSLKDKLLLVLGVLSGLTNGVMMPLMTTVFGDALNTMGTLNGNDVGGGIRDVALKFLAIGLVAWAANYVQFATFRITSVRYVAALKVRFLRAALRQDIAYYDATRPAKLLSRMAEATLEVGDGIGEKLGMLFQFTGMFVGGFALGFRANWQLSLVLMSIVPLLAIVGGAIMKIMTKATEQAQEGYAAAGAIVDETVANMRTVTMLAAGEERAAVAYDAELDIAEVKGIEGGKASGFTIGFMNLTIFEHTSFEVIQQLPKLHAFESSRLQLAGASVLD